MSVQNEIDRIISSVEAAHLKVTEKGGTTSRPYLVGNLESAIDSIPEAKDPVLQSKTVSPSASSQTVTADSGYDGLSSVTVNAMPTATQATPSITVSRSGLITAKATQSEGYVASGEKSATKQLTVQAAKTVTPSTSNQTAVQSGRYTTGTVTVKGDANLKAENIKSGTSIFGVAGTYEGSGGGLTVEDVDVVNSSVHVIKSMPTYLNYTLTDGTNTSTAKFIVANTDPIVPGVIKSGTTILGVTGTYEGSGGGGSVETRTVTIAAGNASINRIFVTRYVDGNISAETVLTYGESSATLSDVVRGSAITLVIGGTTYPEGVLTLTNATVIGYYSFDMEYCSVCGLIVN